MGNSKMAFVRLTLLMWMKGWEDETERAGGRGGVDRSTALAGQGLVCGRYECRTQGSRTARSQTDSPNLLRWLSGGVLGCSTMAMAVQKETGKSDQKDGQGVA